MGSPEEPVPAPVPKRGRGRPRKAVVSQHALELHEAVTPGPGRVPASGPSAAEVQENTAASTMQESLEAVLQRPAAGGRPSGPSAYVPTATFLGIDGPAPSTTSPAPDIAGAPPMPTSSNTNGEPRPLRTAIAAKALQSTRKAGPPSQRRQPGRPRWTGHTANAPRPVPTTLAIRPIAPGSKRPPEMPAGEDGGQHESDDSSIPGMDYNPLIPTEPIIAEGDGSAEGAAQEPPGGPAAPVVQPPPAANQPPKDRFSLSDLEATLARMMRPRAVETGKPADALRIARSGTFVWDVEKLGPPQRKKADMRRGTAFSSSALQPYPAGAPAGTAGTATAVDQNAVPSIAPSVLPEAPAPVIAPAEKRGRGRPRKRPVIAAPEIKRKRGRPRKNPVILVAEAAVKRPRGRPPKVRPDPAGEPIIKRKRGRPPKNAQPAVQGQPVP